MVAARAVSPLLVMGPGAATTLLMEAELAAPAASGAAPPLTAAGAAPALLTGLELAAPAATGAPLPLTATGAATAVLTAPELAVSAVVTVTVTVYCVVTVTVACGPHTAEAPLPAAGDPESAFSLPVWPLPAATDAAAGWELTLPPIGPNATSSLVAGGPMSTDGDADVLAATTLGASSNALAMDGCTAGCEGVLMMPVLSLHLLRFEDDAAKDVADEYSAAEEDAAEDKAAEGCESITGLGTVVALAPG